MRAGCSVEGDVLGGEELTLRFAVTARGPLPFGL